MPRSVLWTVRLILVLLLVPQLISLSPGIHCDSKGNVYAGVGDGVHVWNPSGTLLGKIFLGEESANFQFAGDGRMVIGAETHLYYATLAAKGAPIS